MKNLILTEKPSQGREMAAGLGEKFTNANGYLESDSYVVTWAVGHLVELSAPADYDPKYEKWSFDNLPIIPEQYKYRVKDNTAQQFNVIKSLLKRKDIDMVIEAGDPGREGELISRLILLLSGNNKPVYRFWVTMALDETTIRKGMNNLKSAGEYEGLYNSALCRQQADWLIGMNASRAVTLKFGETCSIGRVQTPTLAIIVKREEEIKKFVPKDYWTITAEFKHAEKVYTGKWIPSLQEKENDSSDDSEDSKDAEDNSRIFDKAAAEQIVNAVKGQNGIVDKIINKKNTEKPPLLFSLTDLQIEANKKFGLTADKTLNIAQELYETDKALSYPRTEAKHLPTNIVDDVSGILGNLTGVVQFDVSKCSVDVNNKRVFDNTKLTDHHALIPTGKIPDISGEKKDIYALVCERFIASFYPDYEYLSTVIYTAAAGSYFKTSGKVVTNAGWREVHAGIPKDVVLPKLEEKDAVIVSDTKLASGKTTPPPRYSESDILKAMESVAKFIANDKYRKILKETSGLGTPATRAAILETLKKRYLTVEKKKLVPNETGIKLIETLKSSQISNPLYTAKMEQELEDIARNGKSADEFMEEVKAYAAEFVAWAKGLNITTAERKSKYQVIAKCPKCGGNITAFDRVYSCSNTKEGKCNMSVWRNGLAKLGKPNITEKEAISLISGKSIKVNLKSGAKKYTATAKLEAGEKGYYVKVEFDKK
jgi:DNA topoisomerase-3